MRYIDANKKRRKIIIPRIKGELIERVELISIEEYSKWRTIIAKIDGWWWLQSLGYGSDYAAIVDSDGYFHYFGYSVRNSYGGVVPALYLKSNNLIVGSKYYIIVNGERIKATVVENNILITDKSIDFHRFDESSNSYETSEIKQWLNEWKGKIK